MTGIPTELVGAAGIALTALGGVIGAWIAARAKAQQTAAQASDRLIDQLQEERDGYRESHEGRITAAEQRLTEVERRNGILVDRNDRYRDLLHKHRAHIWDGKPPPPPEWPDDLPR
ncbi:hypothetical protein [Microbacterium karelineae]|uniref:hypothetical protein n=1 Tax=Microbacterium karelineae TaxID=2654283 RepID=UPI0012E9A3FB|nr:hypothetical protein [Microbacterium karelineae]